MAKPNELLRTGKEILRAEGPVSLVRRACAFVSAWFFERQTYDLYAHYPQDDRTLGEARPVSGLVDLRHEIVTTNQQADDLEVEGLELRSRANNTRKRLDRGAVASCVFVGSELANIVWVATTQRAKDSLNEPPFKTDFSKNEVWVGDGWTNPKYRRRGLRVHGHLKGTQFLVGRGILVSRYAIAKRNMASLMSTRKVDVHRYAEGRYVRLLHWKFCREIPLSEGQQELPTSSAALTSCDESQCATGKPGVRFVTHDAGD